MENLSNPTARRDGLVVQETPGEVLVFDTKSNKAMCLNETAASVWKHCTGENNLTDIAKLLEKEFSAPVPEELVWLAIDQLGKDNLLQASETVAAPKGLSRREVIRRVGIAAVVALPLVTSLAVPRAAYAGACSPTPIPAGNCAACPDGTPCDTNPGTTTCQGGSCV
ncbi:MAG: PqqD family protein [Pyrinomonadaceae bacterium]|nr:PqqD family protein [Pyrinomonadaceae bacterium]